VFSPAFFLHCYDLRSELVHGGNVRDAHEQATVIAAALAVLFPTIHGAICELCRFNHGALAGVFPSRMSAAFSAMLQILSLYSL
jgi:hypothetical protein